MSLHNQVWSPKITSTLVGSEDAREQLLEECEEIWKQMEEVIGDFVFTDGNWYCAFKLMCLMELCTQIFDI